MTIDTNPKYTFRFYPASLATLCNAPVHAGLTLIETELTFEDAVAFIEANPGLSRDGESDPREAALNALAVTDQHGVLSFDLGYVVHWCSDVLGDSEDDPTWELVPGDAVPVSRWAEFLQAVLAEIDVESDQFSEVDFESLRRNGFPDLFTEPVQEDNTPECE